MPETLSSSEPLPVIKTVTANDEGINAQLQPSRECIASRLLGQKLDPNDPNALKTLLASLSSHE